MNSWPLSGMLVVELSSGVAGGYCTKALADGGSDVIKVECPEGDPLRRWAIGGRIPEGEDSPLFQFLGCSKKSVIADPDRTEDLERVRTLVRAADVVVWSRGSRLAKDPDFAPESLMDLAPHAVVAAITPFGLEGPWAERSSNDLTLQAWAGGVFSRGAPNRPPVQVGARPSEWLAGIFTAVGILSASQRVEAVGRGELLDVSILESLVLTQQTYAVTRQTMTPPGAVPTPERSPKRDILLPAIYRTTDSWVGFLVATATMWESFCVMVDHPEWIDDERLYAYKGRLLRGEEIEAATQKWCGSRSTQDVLELAELLRIPAAPVTSGSTVTSVDHFLDRRLFVRNPRTGWLQPDVAYSLGAGVGRRPVEPSPRLGEHTGYRPPPRKISAAAEINDGRNKLPFEGVRVADFTAFWAGSIVGHYLAMLGADVIHVESTKRPDGIRGHTVRSTDDDRWWEWTPLFHGPNTNKRGITLDMTTESGRALAERLIGRCDVMLENYAPRVMSQWGLTEDRIRELRGDIIYVRMPAFGLDGPWKNRTGYAQCMEMSSGLAWMTGYSDDRPQVPNGMGDPLSGLHALLGLHLAMAHRISTGEGMTVEAPMIGGALNIAAEMALEHQAFGKEMCRDGNRGPTGSPQNIYLTADAEEDGSRDCWVAVGVECDEQWVQLRKALGEPDWAMDARYLSYPGRRAAEDAIDDFVGRWCQVRTADEIVEVLTRCGVPVAKVVGPAETQHNPQLQARGFFETVTHPLTGQNLHPGWPVRFRSGPTRVHRRPTPTLGQHNREVLIELLGVSEEEFALLEEKDVIGTRLLGEHRTR